MGICPEALAFEDKASGESVVVSVRGNRGWRGLDKGVGKSVAMDQSTHLSFWPMWIQHSRDCCLPHFRMKTPVPKAVTYIRPTDEHGQGATVGTLPREPGQWGTVWGCSRVWSASLASLSWDLAAQLFLYAEEF
jgi:hypothetical protein